MLILYGIKNCDTVKKARLWLAQRNIPYRFHDYRADGLDDALLHGFETALGWETLLNRKSASWRQLAPEQQQDIDREHALRLMHANPTLIKRPVLQDGDRFIIGFTPELYQKELCAQL